VPQGLLLVVVKLSFSHAKFAHRDHQAPPVHRDPAVMLDRWDHQGSQPMLFLVHQVHQDL